MCLSARIAFKVWVVSSVRAVELPQSTTSSSVEDQIDIYFVWHEKVLLRAMQVHYATLSGRERMRSARITGIL